MSQWKELKKCKECGVGKSLQAYQQDKDICSICVTEIIQEKWANGIATYRKCKECGEHKNASPNFYVTTMGVMYNTCKTCKALYHHKRRGVIDAKPNCNYRGTVVDEQRCCRKCDEIKHIDMFYTNYADCRKCLGRPEKKLLQRKGKNVKPCPREGDTMQCNKCDEFKPFDEFYKDSKNIYSFGRQRACKICTNDRKREWYEKNKDKAPIIGKENFLEKFNNMKEEMFNDTI